MTVKPNTSLTSCLDINGGNSKDELLLCQRSQSYSSRRRHVLLWRVRFRFQLLEMGFLLCLIIHSLILRTSAFNHERQCTLLKCGHWSARTCGKIHVDHTECTKRMGVGRLGKCCQMARNNLPADDDSKSNSNNSTDIVDVESYSSDREMVMLKRIQQLEQLVAMQTIEIRRLKQDSKKLTEAAAAFSHVLEMLREAGLETDTPKIKKELFKPGDDDDDATPPLASGTETIVEYFDDEEIFGKAPSSVTDAADAAGAAILAAMLGGKQRMLVDVRDAELTRDPETLVQFVELSILPVAAGLEGLKTARNRVKIVFPTVSQLLEYRRTMALAAPEVVALSTLGFDPIEDQDQLVVILSPAPDDDEGLEAMNRILNPSDKTLQISQPLVVLNHHMVPISGPAKDYDVVYHLRLLSVQYMAGPGAPDYFEQLERSKKENRKSRMEQEPEELNLPNATDKELDRSSKNHTKGDDEALEAAMQHAHQSGMNRGVTRAMVIRAYPNAWHVFVDISPSTDADFVIAASFGEEPSLEEVNLSIVECLEGSEREDELVAQQMQQALEAGQLDILKLDVMENNDEEDEDKDDYLDDFDMFAEDSV